MTLWSFKIKNTTALIAFLFKRLYKEYCHENSHLECQFTQRAFATSLAMAHAASTRCAGVARIKNGVAIISRSSLQDVQTGLPQMPDDTQQRVIAATINGVRVINVYCVNGEALDSPKFEYKRKWFAALTQYVRDEMQRYSDLMLLGDFNIAPTDDDVYDPQKWHEQIHCSSQERAWFQDLLNLGLTDALRQVYPTGEHATWWDYRGAMFQKGLGLRIDHILISQTLSARLQDVWVDKETRALERPSDHAPVVGIFQAA